ncbi:MAG: PHP domain-containing protein [Coriobacteriales bacterium]
MNVLDDIRIEMHSHTDCSDGVVTPEELVGLAAAKGLTHLAITDHDTFAALDRARAVLPSGMRLIPGVEISAAAGERDVHVLGYFLDEHNAALNAEIARCSRSRDERSAKMADNLAADGYHVSAAILAERGLTPNRSNIARLLVEAGDLENTDVAFATVLNRKSKYYVPRRDVEVHLAVRLIKDAGGIAVVAHPRHYHVVDVIDELIPDGLDGVECFHSEQTVEDEEFLVPFARERGLLVTGGSDFHGDSVHPSVLAGNMPSQEDIRVFLDAGRARGFEV